MPSFSVINVDVSLAVLLRLQVFSDIMLCPRRPESSSGMFEVTSAYFMCSFS
jgi:hypothetical protein